MANILVFVFPKCIVIDLNRNVDTEISKMSMGQALNNKLRWVYFSKLLSKQEYRLSVKHTGILIYSFFFLQNIFDFIYSGMFPAMWQIIS